MLTKAIVQNESFTEAYLLRAEVLWEMRQAKDALNDLEQVLKLNPEEEEALLLKATIISVWEKIRKEKHAWNRL